MDLNRKNVRALLGIVAFGVTLFVALSHLGVVLEHLQTALGMISFFTVGLCVAFLLNAPLRLIETRIFAPLNKRLGVRWQRIRRPLSMVLTVLLVLALVFLVVFMVIPELGRTFTTLAAQIPPFMAQVSAEYSKFMAEYSDAQPLSFLEEIDWAKLGDTVVNTLKQWGTGLLSGTMSAASSIVSAVVSFVIGVIVSLYVLYNKEKLSGQVRRLLHAFLPDARAERILYVCGQANTIFARFIAGQFTEALILGALFFIGMTLFGFMFAPMVAVLVAVTSFIPIFGAFIGALTGAFMILVNQGVVKMLWFVLFFLVLQQIEGNLIYPHVVGKSVQLPGLWVLVAVTLGGNLAGILGMLVSVPLCSLLYTLLREAVDRRTAAKLDQAQKTGEAA